MPVVDLKTMNDTLQDIKSDVKTISKAQIDHGNRLIGIETTLKYVATREDITRRISKHINDMHKKDSINPSRYKDNTTKIIVAVGAAIAAVVSALAWIVIM